jgi:glycosyltransferase involved in cell wall biosynthesis
MKKKILIFTLFYYPNPVSGAEVAVKEITDRLKNSNNESEYEFHAVTLRGGKKLLNQSKEGEVLVHRIFPGINENPTLSDFTKFPYNFYKKFFQIFAGLKAIQLHLKYKFDAVWVLMPHSAGAPAGLFNIFFPKVPIILTLQEGDPIDHIEKSVLPLWPLFVRVFIKAKVVQAISSYLGDWAKRRGSNCPIHIIYNGANENDFKQEIDEEAKQKMLNKINKKDGEILLVSTSRLVEKNAMDDVVSALKYLPENIRFVVAGNGEDLEKLNKQAEDLNLKNRVMFLGQVDRKETAILRRIGDIFVRPSRSEGLGNSFAGAFAARIPVIATQEGGIAEFLFDKDRNKNKPTTGFAVDKNSPEQIAKQVLFILENKEFVKKVTDNAYNLVVTDYRWDNIAKSMKEKVFDYVLKSTV